MLFTRHKTIIGYLTRAAFIAVLALAIMTSGLSDTFAASSKSKTKAFADMTSKEFTSYLKDQGFPASYRTLIKSLHKKHPNWVFVADKTGLKWNTVLSKETANGVSLIHSSLPISYRSTDSRSYTGTSISVYKGTNTSSKVTTLASGETVTLNSEVWKGSTRWSKITSGSGKTGYVKGTPNSVSHSNYITAKTNKAKVNVRSGAGTENKAVKTLANKNTSVKIVLRVTDRKGDYWYKIKNGSGYAYIKACYVTLPKSGSKAKTGYPDITPSSSVKYWPVPDTSYPSLGKLVKGNIYSIIAKVTSSSGVEWYKVCCNGKIVYVKASGLKPSGKVASANMPTSFKGRVTADALNFRKKASTSSGIICEIKEGSSISLKGTKNAGGMLWYKAEYNGKTGYVCSDYVDIILLSAPSVLAAAEQANNAPEVSALTGRVSYRGWGVYYPKDGVSWYNASQSVVAYYLDPRNFINEDRIYMFEDLSYKKEYQTKAVVNKVLSPSKLPRYGFTSQMFVNAGSSHKVSPVHLASRARQETGGGSIAITGYKIGGKKVYNPFNIGASSSSNPVMRGLKYAYNAGWTTQKKSVNGGAKFLASGYISKGQNSTYYQRFNVSNGASRVATHQYMTNIQAPYSEALSTKISYASYKITSEPLTFIIPVYSGMPSKTMLP